MRSRAKAKKGTNAPRTTPALQKAAPVEAEVVLDREGALAVSEVVNALNGWARASEEGRREVCETMAIEIFDEDLRAMLAPDRRKNPRWAELLRRCDDELHFTPRQVEDLARFAALDRLVAGNYWPKLNPSVKQALVPLVRGEPLEKVKTLQKLRQGAKHALSMRLDETATRRWVQEERRRSGQKSRKSAMTRAAVTRRVRGAAGLFAVEDAGARFAELVGKLKDDDREVLLDETEQAAQAMLAAVKAARASQRR